MDVYLGLGSNCGSRRAKLEQALGALRGRDVQILRVSPVVESPALLPDGAPPSWNRPFLNIVAECRVRCGPQQLLAGIHEIERELGRDEHEHWSPRSIDIDILLWGAERIATADLTIPHAAMAERAFVLSPLAALNPSLTIPGAGDATVLQRCRSLREHIPLWMGILNVTPDSFSDGGRFVDWPAIEAHVQNMVAGGAQIVDIGAQSTRPGAQPLSTDEELKRLLPPLERLLDEYRGKSLRPRLSVDTYHPSVARRAVELGADIVNDVGGLTDPAMIELAAAGSADWIAMHNLGLPADPGKTLPADVDPCDAVERWLQARIESWARAGLDTARVIFDPGIGFGKNPLQSLALLRGIKRFQRFDLRLLVGHSRKSFMQTYAKRDNHERDLATIGASMYLCAQNVDILRVHNVPDHVTAYRGWSHMVAASS
jgi:2-amino-4-hydroxy-6-hydroxymethyldihydropteridine diphosphokinase/dihydropteroate synthase